jgi:4-diphosphocytidyl-2-C-methyl-D-erythritol kinase
VCIDAPAKVNLLLRILGRVPEGWHQLETVFQAVDLMDHLTLEVTSGDDFRLVVEGADVGPVRDNLVTRAVERFREATGVAGGLRGVLEKRIPAGAGLGGGSSDAGAALRALNLLYGTAMSAGGLAALGAELGADVAFFAGSRGVAIGEGRGDRLRALPGLPERSLVLGLPPVHVATGPAYHALAHAREGGLPVPPPLLEGRVPAGWTELDALAVNDFEAVVPRAHPPVAEALDALRAEGSVPALLSGSGGAVFGGLPAGREPSAMVEALARRAPGIRWIPVRTLDRLPEPSRVERDREMG